MKTTILGCSTLAVSKLCMGTMTFGEQNTPAQSFEIMDHALASGINFFDVAEMYPVKPRAETFGDSERIVGQWLKTKTRSEVILATKVAGPARGMNWIRGGTNDISAASVRAACEDSLQRLQTDYIDLYQIHWPSRNVPNFGMTRFDPKREREADSIADTLCGLDDLVKAGKVRAVGVSNESAWGVSEFGRVAKAENLSQIASIQNPYSLVNRHYEQALDETCFRENVGLLAYSPLAFGQLTNKYNEDANAHGRLTIFDKNWSPRYMREDTLAACAAYAALARAHGFTPTELAIAWCWNQWFIASTIVGATTVAQLDEQIGAIQKPLSPELIAGVETIHKQYYNPAQ